MGFWDRPCRNWFVCGLFILAPILMPSAAVAATLLPFKADYSLELVSALPETNIINADGLMHSELLDQCDGWASSEEFFLNLRNTEGDSQVFAAKTRSLEAKNGETLQFKNSRVIGSVDHEAEVMQGHAAIKKNEATAYFTLPEATRVRLDPKVIFPATLTRTIIDAAMKGKNFLNLTVFDGSIMEKGVLVSVVIGKVKRASHRLDDPLLRKNYWPMAVAFFSPSNQTEIADYQVDMEITENGIPIAMKMNFGEYLVKAELRHFESLPSAKTSCGR